jgi:hypothetical protein
MGCSCNDKCLNKGKYSSNLCYDGGESEDCDLGFVSGGAMIPLNELLLKIMNKLCDIDESQGSYVPFNATMFAESGGGYSVNVAGGVSPYSYQWSLPGSDNSFSIVGLSNTVSISLSGINTPPFNSGALDNSIRLGLVKVEVTDSEGRISKDFTLTATQIYE